MGVGVGVETGVGPLGGVAVATATAVGRSSERSPELRSPPLSGLVVTATAGEGLAVVSLCWRAVHPAKTSASATVETIVE